MTTTVSPLDYAHSQTADAVAQPRDDAELTAAITAACNRMAPSWPC